RLTRFRRAIRIFGINQIGPVVVSTSRSGYQHLFFFKQKTAYEIYLAAADVDQAARAASFRSRSDDQLKEVNKSYNKKKTHAPEGNNDFNRHVYPPLNTQHTRT